MTVKATFIFVLLLSIVNYNSIYAQSKQLSKAQIQEDLNYLKSKLEKYHVNLYTYSTPKEIDHWFKNQEKQLKDSLTYLETFKRVTSIAGILKDGHSYIYPSSQYLDSFFTIAPLFPLDVLLEDNELIVVQDCSDEQVIPIGAQLTSINNVAIKTIQETIISNIAQDGNNLEYPKYLFYKFFPAYYSAFFGFKKEFTIEYIDDEGELKKVEINGLQRDKRRTNETKNNKNKKGIQLKIDTQRGLAILSILSFDNGNLKKDYQQKFKKEVKQAFQTISENEVSNLVIDIRDNEGGELSNGVYLLKRFMNEEFQCVNAYFTIKEGENGERIEKQLNNKWDDTFKPTKRSHFDGNVYFFVNGGSFSCSAIVSNTFKESRRGVVLGSMTGGSAFINAGSPNKTITLPHSKILFTIPRTRYQLRANLSEIGLGVTPNIKVNDTSTYFINGEDAYMKALYKLLEKYN